MKTGNRGQNRLGPINLKQAKQLQRYGMQGKVIHHGVPGLEYIMAKFFVRYDDDPATR